MTRVLLRDARPTDAGAVGAILSEFVDTTGWMPRLHTRAQDFGFAGDMIERGWVRVAETQIGVAGFLARDGAQVHALYVRSDARCRGFGTALLQDAQARAHALQLQTFQANTAAQRFYLRHGFAETERSDGRDNDEGLPDVTYCWSNAGATTLEALP